MDKRLKLLREKNLNLTQGKFADSLGVPLTTISKYERGEVKPTSEFLIKLSKIYGVNLNWLLAGEGTMFKSGSQDRLVNIPDPNGNLSTALKMLSELPEERQKDCLNFIWDKKLISDLKNEVDELRSRIEKLENG